MRYIVGISEMAFSKTPGDLVVTHALGSCVGISLYDPHVQVGGILHYMLPTSSLDKAKADKNPLMFGDTAIPMFFKKAYEMGARKEHLRVVMAGGATVIRGAAHFDIGNRNVLIARKLFWKNSVMIDAEDVGKDFPRTLYLEIGTGSTWYTTRGQTVKL